MPLLDLGKYEGMTKGPWKLWTGSSWRRFGSEATGKTVCEPIIQLRDNQPDLHFANGCEDGPDALAIADLPLMIEEIKRLRMVLEKAKEALTGYDKAIQEVDARRALAKLRNAIATIDTAEN